MNGIVFGQMKCMVITSASFQTNPIRLTAFMFQAACCKAVPIEISSRKTALNKGIVEYINTVLSKEKRALKRSKTRAVVDILNRKLQLITEGLKGSRSAKRMSQYRHITSFNRKIEMNYKSL